MWRFTTRSKYIILDQNGGTKANQYTGAPRKLREVAVNKGVVLTDELLDTALSEIKVALNERREQISTNVKIGHRLSVAS